MEESKPVFLEYARVMISFLVEVRGIALKDLEPEIVADAMIRGAAAESVVWRERESAAGTTAITPPRTL